MTTISRTTTTTTTTTTYNNNVGSDAATKASQLAQLTQTLNELASKINSASSQPTAPAQSQDGMMETAQAPVDLSGGASAPKQMDAYSAAKTLSDHFALTDGVGFDGRGGNSGDGLIGQRDLEQLVKPDSGAPPELKAAAQFMIDHQAVASAVSQGRGVTKNDTLMSKSELDAFAASGPKSAPSTPAANPNLLPKISASLMSQLGQLGNTSAASAPKPASTPQPQAQAQASAPKQMDAYSAAKTLSDHFALTDGVGFDGRGGNSGDGLIGQRDLEQIVKPDSGAPPELKAAAQFMIDHQAVASAVSQGRGVSKNDTLMSKSELDAFAASGPKSAPAPQQSKPAYTLQPQAPASRPLDIQGAVDQIKKQTFNPPTQGFASAPKPMDVYGAAQVLKNHFALAEGVGFDGRGGNSGDNRIGRLDVEQLVKPGSGAPEELKQAARFLLDHPTMAEAMVGDRSTGTITSESLDKFLANAPKAAAPQNLMPMMSASLMSQLGRMG